MFVEQSINCTNGITQFIKWNFRHQTNFQAEGEEEVHLSGIIHEYFTDDGFRLFIDGSSGRSFVIFERKEIKHQLFKKLELNSWQCPLDLIDKYLGSIHIGLKESTLGICKVFQNNPRSFAAYSDDGPTVWMARFFTKYLNLLIGPVKLCDMIFEARTRMTAKEILSTDQEFEVRVKMDGKTYHVFEATK